MNSQFEYVSNRLRSRRQSTEGAGLRVYDIKKGTFRASLLAEESSLFSFYGEAIHEQNELRSSEKPRRGDFANELSV